MWCLGNWSTTAFTIHNISVHVHKLLKTSCNWSPIFFVPQVVHIHHSKVNSDHPNNEVWEMMSHRYWDSQLAYTRLLTNHNRLQQWVLKHRRSAKYNTVTEGKQASTTVVSCPDPSLVPRPHPALHCLKYGKAGRAWYLFSCEHDIIGKWPKNLQQTGCVSRIV